ncbi:hypothetical protein ACJQWK_06576 [Exserohilum turcicum]
MVLVTMGPLHITDDAHPLASQDSIWSKRQRLHAAEVQPPVEYLGCEGSSSKTSAEPNNLFSIISVCVISAVMNTRSICEEL